MPQTCGFRGKSEFARRFYSKQYLKRGKIAFLPRFPYEHTDGGECGAHKKRRAPNTNRAPEKSQRSEIFGKEERQAQRARRRTWRAVCHGALTRRAAEGRNRRQHGEAARTAGFPLPHGKFFCQLKRIFVNLKTILAQAKPRFCASALNLRGSAHAGKVKAVRVL
ncbi:MAG TPA: hypothetical protein H9851_02855 [Candidatus Borkfalkia faecavium]|uniref:Uncharacterized protein n=1 Tax=Candidatus Borkfalkia faecavium TaxID=2838508 RepID=A0A9D2AV31_9FIRM|nr:hypothetical protein [Candidatus Borkfalkia faecavium]